MALVAAVTREQQRSLESNRGGNPEIRIAESGEVEMTAENRLVSVDAELEESDFFEHEEGVSEDVGTMEQHAKYLAAQMLAAKQELVVSDSEDSDGIHLDSEISSGNAVRV